MTEAIKKAVRSALAKHEEYVAKVEEAIWEEDRNRALEVATAVELLRSDDEMLEEVQRLNGDRRFVTEFYDPKQRRRYGPQFAQYRKKTKVDPELWWPWGCVDRFQGADKALARAQWLKKRMKTAPDPKAVAIDAGVAFAGAAAASANLKDSPAASLEATARKLFDMATLPTNPKTVVRRAAKVAEMKETFRRRALMRPEVRLRDEVSAMRIHARHLAAERRTQRSRRQTAHLTLFRDAIRSKGKPGCPMTRADPPDILVATKHATRYLDLFSLHDDDHTDSEDEDDYPAYCRFFGGTVVKATRTTKLGGDDIAMPSPSPAPQETTGTISSGSTMSSLVGGTTIATTDGGLLPAPSLSELRSRRTAALMMVHRLLSSRGVRHVDKDLGDVDWEPNSVGHLASGSLGRLADLEARVLEELLAHGDKCEHLAALGVLKAKVGAEIKLEYLSSAT